MSRFQTTGIVGAGVIGASWAALFLAAGKRVQIFDADPEGEAKVRAYINQAWPTLEELSLVKDGGELVFTRTIAEAVSGADFIQENVPERIEVKHKVFSEIETALSPHAIVASSASGLLVKEMQEGWADPSRFILGHPFNPPHLIPLVELLGNDKTADDVLDLAEAFYAEIGKITIRVHKEVPGHVANRLQAALWREVLHLAQEGVASVEDIDTAVWSGPGLRWAAHGPTTLFHLGAGPGGIEEFTNRYTASFNRWWDDLGDPRLDAASAKLLADGMANAESVKDMDALLEKRDQLILASIKARQGLAT